MLPLTKKPAIFVIAIICGLYNISAFAGAKHPVMAIGYYTNDTVPVVGAPTEEDVFQKVEVEASVNREAWIKHLETHLQPVIENAAKKMAKAGKYVVNVRFLVERDGSISDVKAMNNPGFGLAKGAVEVVKSGPRWSPGMVNGRTVRSYHTQPITFVFTN